MEELQKEFERQCIKSLVNPETAIDEIWNNFVLPKIKDAKISECQYWQDQIFSPEFQSSKPTISLTDFILRISELKGEQEVK